MARTGIAGPRSVRARAALGVAAIVLAALGLGAAGFVAVLNGTLVQATTGTAVARLEALGRLVARDGADAVGDVRTVLAQVQDEDGEVLAAAPGTGVRPLSQTDGAIVARDGQDWIVVSDDVAVPGEDDDQETLVVGVSVAEAEQAVGVAALLLAVGVPLVTALMALLTWVVVGRALAPVERMRAEVEEIGTSSLDRRIDEPATGDEIARLAGTMNRLIGRLETAQSAQRGFVSDASHELRSPLAVLRQYAELAQSHPEVVEPGTLTTVVLEEGARLESIVEQLLLLARLDERAPRRSAPVDLDALAAAEARRVGQTAPLAVDLSTGGAGVLGDEALLARALRNLVDNAVRHADRRVAIAVDRVPAGVRAVVEDDGPGVPAADRGRVFERFARLDDDRARASGGTGLGLAIVQAIAASHGGTAGVDDSPLGGARFTLLLPVEDSAEAPLKRPSDGLDAAGTDGRDA